MRHRSNIIATTIHALLTIGIFVIGIIQWNSDELFGSILCFVAAVINIIILILDIKDIPGKYANPNYLMRMEFLQKK